jgi:hypothetical protein
LIQATLRDQSAYLLSQFRLGQSLFRLPEFQIPKNIPATRLDPSSVFSFAAFSSRHNRESADRLSGRPHPKQRLHFRLFAQIIPILE